MGDIPKPEDLTKGDQFVKLRECPPPGSFLDGELLIGGCCCYTLHRWRNQKEEDGENRREDSKEFGKEDKKREKKKKKERESCEESNVNHQALIMQHIEGFI